MHQYPAILCTHCQAYTLPIVSTACVQLDARRYTIICRCGV